MTFLSALETSVLSSTLAQLNADPEYLAEYRDMCSEAYKDFNGFRGRHMFSMSAEELVAWWGDNYTWQATPGNEAYAPHYGYWTWRNEEMNAADSNYFCYSDFQYEMDRLDEVRAAIAAEAAAEEAEEQFYFECERYYGYRVRLS